MARERETRERLRKGGRLCSSRVARCGGGSGERGALVREVGRYLAAHRVRKLQIGAGHNLLPGWLHTDRNPRPGAVYLDATEPFSFVGATFDYVFSEHLIEHLPQEGASLCCANATAYSNPDTGSGSPRRTWRL